MAFEREEICGFAVIGDPLMHTLSPLIYNTLFDIYDIPGWYFAATVPKEGLSNWVGIVRGGKISGFNVTMPHKRAIVPFLDCISDEAAELGAVNTVAVRRGRLFGTSTDGKGFVASLQEQGIALKDKKVLIIGAGGVVPSLVQALDREGALNVTILSRKQGAGEDAVSGLSLSGGLKCSFDHLKPEALKGACKGCDILINATPLGMHGCAQDYEDFDFLDLLERQAVVCDLIYKPAVTELMAQAEQRGLRTVGGLGMLIWQAFWAFEFYVGILPKTEDMEKVLSRLDTPPGWELGLS